MKHNVFAVIDFSVSIMNEDTQHFNKICRVEMMRKYELVCDLLVKDLSTINIVVNMLGVRKKFEMSLSNLQFIMKLDNDINVQITLRKKIKTEN
jgi:short-subunit dehydrogenase involved in D-alanine esterification of teichoic acids